MTTPPKSLRFSSLFFRFFPFAKKVWCSQDGHLRERKYQGLLHAGVVSLVRWPFRWDDLKKITPQAQSSQAKVAAWYFVVYSYSAAIPGSTKKMASWKNPNLTDSNRKHFLNKVHVLFYCRVTFSKVTVFWCLEVLNDFSWYSHVREWTFHQNGPCRAPAAICGLKTPFINMCFSLIINLFHEITR